MNSRNFVNKTIICSVIFLITLTAHAGSLPSDPNNAALLYYQALLVLPEPDYFANELINGSTTEEIYEYLNGAKLDPEPEKEIKKIIHDIELMIKGISPDPNKQLSPHEKALYKDEHFKERRLDELDLFKELLEQHKKMKGIDPNKVIREYLRKCGQSIALAQAASEIPKCDWGVLYSQGFDFHISQTVEITKILRIDALRLAADGNYRAALERCLMMCRLARHISDEGIILHSISLKADGIAFGCIKCIIESMPLDADTLVGLKAQLVSTRETSESFIQALEIDVELALQKLSKNPKTITWIRSRLIGATVYAEGKEVAEEFKNITDEKLIAVIIEDASQIFPDFFSSVRRAIESEKPYKQTYTELELLTYKLRRHDELVPFYDFTSIELTPRFYNLNVNRRTIVNSVKGAIEIYLVVAMTGRLPESLPDGLPKDPYTLEDFKYEITKEGFALYSQGEDFQGRLKQKLEFKVKK